MQKSVEEQLITQLTKIAGFQPIIYQDFNKFFSFRSVSGDLLRELEKEDPRIGLAGDSDNDVGVTPLSIMATITAFLTGKRLAAITRKRVIGGKEIELILGFCWYQQPIPSDIKAMVDKHEEELFRELEEVVSDKSRMFEKDPEKA